MVTVSAPSSLPRLGHPEPSDADFALFQCLVEEETGIHLAPTKKALLAGRLSRRLREVGVPDLRAYYRLVTEPGAEEERRRMLECLLIHETRFFREPEQLAHLTGSVVPTWREEAAAGLRTRRIEALSAGCATGEEPYTLAMILRAGLPAVEGWEAMVLGTDLSANALRHAAEGKWPAARGRDIPDALRREFMLRGVGPRAAEIAAGPELRRMVRFRQVNLVAEDGVAARYDLVFCRNVLIYFQPDTRLKVLTRVAAQVAPGGYLFLGYAEGLAGNALADFCRIDAAVFRRAR